MVAGSGRRQNILSLAHGYCLNSFQFFRFRSSWITKINFMVFHVELIAVLINELVHLCNCGAFVIIRPDVQDLN